MSGWLEAFIVVATIAIVLQMAILLAMFLQVRAALQQFQKLSSDFHSKVVPILARVNSILEDSEDRIASIMGDAAELTRVARNQAQKIDRVVTETVERLRINVLRADIILTGVLEVIEELGTTLRGNIWGPVKKASGLIRGIQVGLDFLRGSRKRRSEVDATQDEELFI